MKKQEKQKRRAPRNNECWNCRTVEKYPGYSSHTTGYLCGICTQHLANMGIEEFEAVEKEKKAFRPKVHRMRRGKRENRTLATAVIKRNKKGK